jgi:hypothetical protein
MLLLATPPTKAAPLASKHQTTLLQPRANMDTCMDPDPWGDQQAWPLATQLTCPLAPVSPGSCTTPLSAGDLRVPQLLTTSSSPQPPPRNISCQHRHAHTRDTHTAGAAASQPGANPAAGANQPMHACYCCHIPSRLPSSQPRGRRSGAGSTLCNTPHALSFFGWVFQNKVVVHSETHNTALPAAPDTATPPPASKGAQHAPALQTSTHDTHCAGPSLLVLATAATSHSSSSHRFPLSCDARHRSSLDMLATKLSSACVT